MRKILIVNLLNTFVLKYLGLVLMTKTNHKWMLDLARIESDRRGACWRIHLEALVPQDFNAIDLAPPIVEAIEKIKGEA